MKQNPRISKVDFLQSQIHFFNHKKSPFLKDRLVYFTLIAPEFEILNGCQGIPEWTKRNLWKTDFKKFTWSILNTSTQM